MQSMTGFGFVSSKIKDFKIEVSVKSVNSRFLDIKFYISSYYIPLEMEFKKIISKKCYRGFFTVHIERHPQKPPYSISLNWDKKQAQKWKRLYDNLSREMNLKNDIQVSDLIRGEGVLNLIEKPQSLSTQEKKKVRSCFFQAFQACLQERKREGMALKKDILSNLSAMQGFFREIKDLNKKQSNTQLKRKSEVIKNKKTLDMSLETEKTDIHEEIVRWGEHLKHLKKISRATEAVGRKMDFYVQEILRELNTIGSKSQIARLTFKVVEAKSFLEKIKEQIQNIE